MSNQNPHVERLLMTAFVLGLPETKVRVIAPDVGGGFGSKIYLYAERRGARVGEQARQPSDQVGRRAQRSVRVRRARTRSRHACGARVRRERQVPRDARHHDREPRRVPVHVRVVHPDDPLRDAAGGAVHDACDLLRGDGVVHQHRSGRRVSRRGPARGDVRRRASRAPGRGRSRHSAGRDPPSQLHPQVPATQRRSRSRTTPATTTRRSTKR